MDTEQRMAHHTQVGEDTTSLLSLSPSDNENNSPFLSSSFASDKENRNSSRMHPSSSERRKRNSQAIFSRNMSSTTGDASSKRRRLTGKGLGADSQTTHKRRLQLVNDTDFYDPDQNIEERRAVRKGLRDLARDLNDSRADFLRPESHGIRNTLERANEFFKSVKQTFDATIDSHLLVSAVDLSYKQTAQAILGDSATGIDVDEFVSKCISFMRRGLVQESQAVRNASSQHRRRRVSGHDGDAEGSGDEGDALNWDFLGCQACFQHNLRPSLSGFLLGPLSVQKRVRQQTQRRARQERIDPSQVVRPQELQAVDLEKQENSNLTALCTTIRQVLVKTQEKSERLVNKELSQRSKVTRDEAMEVMNKYGISDDGGVPLFRFCINPRSFGQTIENLFYVSFLVRDGSIGVSLDSNELPTLLASQPEKPSEARRKGLQKHQTVFSLDFDTWEELIKVFDIKECLIPHREEDEEIRQANGSGTGEWYN